MNRFVLYLLALVLLSSVSGCQPQPEKASKRNIILDVDTSVDDILSILYFLSCPDINILAITIEKGVSSVDSGAEIVMRLLKLTGHPEIPVARGTGIPLEGNNSFPEQWQPAVDRPFGLDLPEHNLKASGTEASDLIAELAAAYKNDVSVLAFGPMTNIARAFGVKPELAGNIDYIYVSDGAVNVAGGIFMEYPEIRNRVSGWNLWVDARAAAIVFQSGTPVVLVPLDLTALHGNDPLLLTADFAEEYGKKATGITGKLMSTLMENWLESYVIDQQSGQAVRKVPVWDVVAGMIFHHPEIGTEWQDASVMIMEGNPDVAGQIVLTDNGLTNVRICTGGNQATLDSLLLLTASK